MARRLPHTTPISPKMGNGVSLKAVRLYLEGTTTRGELLRLSRPWLAPEADPDRLRLVIPDDKKQIAFVFHPQRRGNWLLALRIISHEETADEFRVRRLMGGIQHPVRWLAPGFLLLHSQQVEGLEPFLLERCWVHPVMEQYRNGFGRFMLEEPETLFNMLEPGYLTAIAANSPQFWNNNYTDLVRLVGDERIRLEIAAHADEWHAKEYREKECRAALVALDCKDFSRQAFEKHCQKLEVRFPEKP